MEIKICDTCHKEVKSLNELIDDYKSERIVHVCDDCLKEINNVMDKATTAIVIVKQNLIRRFIGILRDRNKK